MPWLESLLVSGPPNFGPLGLATKSGGFKDFLCVSPPFFWGGGMFLQFDSSAYFSKRVGEKTPSSLSKPSPDLP